jgi:uncharacterized protein
VLSLKVSLSFNGMNLPTLQKQAHSERPKYPRLASTEVLSNLSASEVSRPKVIFSIEKIGDAIGEFHRFASPRTADSILRILPTGGRIARYGEEVYFQISIKAPSEHPRSTVDVGTIGYWPMGSAVCVFYGPTKPYSPVNRLGRITEGLELFRNVKEGTIVTMKKG